MCYPSYWQKIAFFTFFAFALNLHISAFFLFVESHILVTVLTSAESRQYFRHKTVITLFLPFLPSLNCVTASVCTISTKILLDSLDFRQNFQTRSRLR